ncbi:MAG: hypothetical protein QXL94_07570 [Candidatus Parvarchaeum sp.]
MIKKYQLEILKLIVDKPNIQRSELYEILKQKYEISISALDDFIRLLKDNGVIVESKTKLYGYNIKNASNVHINQLLEIANETMLDSSSDMLMNKLIGISTLKDLFDLNITDTVFFEKCEILMKQATKHRTTLRLLDKFYNTKCRMYVKKRYTAVHLIATPQHLVYPDNELMVLITNTTKRPATIDCIDIQNIINIEEIA